MSLSMKRFHRKRLRNKRMKYYYGGVFHRENERRLFRGGWKKHLNMIIDTPKQCSCWMCGNPRRKKWNGKDKKTKQEHLSDIDFGQQMEEIYSIMENQVDLETKDKNLWELYE